MTIEYKTITEFSEANDESNHLLMWWSEQTHGQPWLLKRSVDFFRTRLIRAIYVMHDEKLIGAAGLIKSLDSQGNQLKWKGRNIVELGSIIVLAPYTGHGIARRLVHERLSFVREMNYFPFTITGHFSMLKILETIAISINDLPEEYQVLLSWTRECNCNFAQKQFCKVCPIDPKKSLYVFKDFL